jgi:predicted PurR-regulated permease PerM
MSEDTGNTGERRDSQTEPTTPGTPAPGEGKSEQGVMEDRSAPSQAQVARTVAVALLTAVVVLGAFFLLWQVRSVIGSLAIALFLAAVLNPPVKWLERRHRMLKRSLAIVITYLGVVVALVLIVGIFVPLLIEETRNLIDFIVGVVQSPGGPTAYLEGLADQYGLGGLFDRIKGQLGDLPSELGELARSFLLSAGQIALSAAGVLVTLVTVLTLTFFLLLGRERLIDGGLRLFPESRRPLVRGIVEQSGGAVSGYVSGNLAISFVAGVTTFILLVVLGIPYPAALALLVAVLDLIPMIGATLGAAVVVVVGLFAAGPVYAGILLVFFLIYQQFEGSVLQPIVYSRAVHLDALTIFVALLVGGALAGIPGALVAIPIAEIIRIVVTDVLAYRRMRREESELEISPPAPPPLAPEPRA